MKISAELYNQAKNAKNAKELTELCRANGLELTQDAAERVMGAMYAHGEIATDELAQCAGGCFFDTPACPICGSNERVNSRMASPTNSSWYCEDCQYQWKEE